jgi:excisionase family DNA binding protein
MPKNNSKTPEPTRGAVTYAPPPKPSVATAAPAETGTIADTRARFGIPRSTQYRLAAAGHIRMVKLGRTTLVDFASVRAFLASAPTVALRSPGAPNEAAPRG